MLLRRFALFTRWQLREAGVFAQSLRPLMLMDHISRFRANLAGVFRWSIWRPFLTRSIQKVRVCAESGPMT
jgi:hypothetical protein